MKRYFDLEDFITWLTLLEDNKPAKLYTENEEDDSVVEYTFMRTEFNSIDIILYDCSYNCVGIIQDSPMSDWEDYAEGVYEDLVMNDEYKVFIKAEKS